MKKPTQEEIMTIDDRDIYNPGTAFWKREVEKNIQEIKERKKKAQEFREWHKNNNNANVVSFYELVKKERSIQDSDSRESAEFWF